MPTRRTWIHDALFFAAGAAIGYKYHEHGSNLPDKDNPELLKQSPVSQKAIFQDKEDAIKQAEAMIPNSRFSETTDGFDKLESKHPWMKSVTSAMGYTRVPYTEDDDNTTNVALGSAALLDDSGTVVFTHHQLDVNKGEKLQMYFLSSRQPDLAVPTKAVIYEPHIDLAFTTIDPKFIKERGLKPLAWGFLGFEEEEKGQEVIAVGWAKGRHFLHASSGPVKNFMDESVTNFGPDYCKVSLGGPAFGGMSGGAVFSSDGKFVGVITSTTVPGTNVLTFFTPVDAIRDAYIQLFPKRAYAAGVFPISQPPGGIPRVCAIDRRNFLTLSR